MKKFLMPFASVVIITLSVFLACSKDEDTSGESSAKSKSSAMLDVNDYYALGEEHNKAFPGIENMDLPRDITFEEVMKIFGETIDDDFNYKDIRFGSTIKGQGDLLDFSSYALSYCQIIDDFPNTFEKQKFDNIDGFIDFIYAFTTNTMHNVFNDFQKKRLQEKEKEHLLMILGVYAKSAEFWTRHSFKNLPKNNKADGLPPYENNFLGWVKHMIQYAVTIDANAYDACVEENDGKKLLKCSRFSKQESKNAYTDFMMQNPLSEVGRIWN